MDARPPLAQERDQFARALDEFTAHRPASRSAAGTMTIFICARSAGLRISVSSAGVSRIRFDGLARCLSARESGHPNEIAVGIYGTARALARAGALA
jgi:hypothetical protein